MEIGTARADPGEIARGYLEVAELPTAISEQVPVVIARGEHDGPTLWVTATQHSGEVTGLAVTLDVVSEDLARNGRLPARAQSVGTAPDEPHRGGQTLLPDLLLR